MVMLSTLQGFRLTDENNNHARLIDLGVALLEDDYPPVTKLYYITSDKQQYALDWSHVSEIVWTAKRIKVSDIKRGEALTDVASGKYVLLMRDVLDALVLDLQNRRATRANDLWLEEDKGQLVLRGADTGSWALLSRLTRGLIEGKENDALYDWKYVEFLRGDPKAVKNGAGYHLRITRLTPGEIAGLSNSLPYLHAAELLTLLPDPQAADTLELMPPERQLQVFEELEQEQAIKLLTLISPDVAADIIGQLKPAPARRYLENLPQPQAERVLELLQYPEDSAGGIMTNDAVFVSADLTIAEARDVLCDRLKQPDFVYFIYAVEDEKSRRLVGTFSLRELIVSNEKLRIEEVMNPYTNTINPLEPAYAAAYRVINSHLAALPVTGAEGRFLGVVTVDAALSQIAPPNWGSQLPRIFS